jgi:hypothetical protein
MQRRLDAGQLGTMLFAVAQLRQSTIHLNRSQERKKGCQGIIKMTMLTIMMMMMMMMMVMTTMSIRGLVEAMAAPVHIDCRAICARTTCAISRCVSTGWEVGAFPMPLGQGADIGAVMGSSVEG